jgi:hypothetical protein
MWTEKRDEGNTYATSIFWSRSSLRGVPVYAHSLETTCFTVKGFCVLYLIINPSIKFDHHKCSFILWSKGNTIMWPLHKVDKVKAHIANRIHLSACLSSETTQRNVVKFSIKTPYSLWFSLGPIKLLLYMRLKSDVVDSVENDSSLRNIIKNVSCRIIFWSVNLISYTYGYDEYLTEWNKNSVNLNLCLWFCMGVKLGLWR